MVKLLVCLTLCMVGVRIGDGHMLFNDHEDDDFAATLPSPTDSESDLFGNKPTSQVVPSTPRSFLTILDLLMIELERKKQERRKQIEAWIMGKRSPFGMLRSADKGGPQCSYCTGNNVADCARKAKVQQCKTTQQCYTVQLDHKQSDKNAVVKGCIDKVQCEEDVCKNVIDSSNGDYKNCTMDCCKGEMCNKLKQIKPLPKPPGPTGPKCYICEGFDEASCAAKRRVTQCESDHKCASVFVVQKSNGKGILAKGCIKTSTCDNGLCKALNQTGLYSSCRGVCCTGDLCDGLSLNSTPTNTPVPKPTVTTAPKQIKCFSCNGNNRTVCERSVSVVQCGVGERCYSGGARLKGSESSSFAKGCIGETIEQCRTYCKRYESKLENCTFACCDGNLCNNGTFTQAPTQRPVTGPKRLWCTHCSSTLSEEDCESGRVLTQCDSIDHLCYFGEASYQSGLKMFAKGCMQPEMCKTACHRLGVGAKFCNVTCCKGDDCNRLIVAPTKTPVKNPNIRALLKLIEAFKVLLEAIENSIRVSAKDYKASNYKDQISSLIRQTQSHSQSMIGAQKNPVVRNARRQLIELRTRADEALQKLGSP